MFSSFLHMLCTLFLVFGAAGGWCFMVLFALCLYNPGMLDDIIASVATGPLKQRRKK